MRSLSYGSNALEISAYTAERARRLTGLTARQIQYWDERGFISPSLTKRKGRGRRRLYSFRDLVQLKVAAGLRQSVSLQLIRKVNDHLRRLDYTNPLAELTFVVDGSRLLFQEGTRWQDSRPVGQTIASFFVPLGAIAGDLRRQIAVDERKTRRPGVIERHRGVLSGRPVFAGTRISVASVKALLDDGATVGEIRHLYPDLSGKDVDAARKVDLSRRRSRAS